MKQTKTKYTRFQKVMIVFIPIIVLLLISAIVMCAAFTFLPINSGVILDTGNITIIMGLVSAALAIAGIVFSIFNKSDDNEEITPADQTNK